MLSLLALVSLTDLPAEPSTSAVAAAPVLALQTSVAGGSEAGNPNLEGWDSDWWGYCHFVQGRWICYEN